MAHLRKKKTTHHFDADDKRCGAAQGVTSKEVVSRKYYGFGVPGLPSDKGVPLAANYEASERMLNNICRDAEQGRAGLPDQKANRLKLGDHIVDFEKDVARGLAARGTKKRQTPSVKQVKLITQRVRDVLEGCAFTHPADLNERAPGKLIDFLQEKVSTPKEKGGCSHQTASFFLAAIRRFVWWLAKKRVSVRSDLFNDVPGFDPGSNRVHARRNIAAAELARLLDAALASTETFASALTGRQRYFLYLGAFASGFRAKELAALKPGNFLIDADRPCVTLAAKKTKSKRAASVPLTPAVTSQFREFLKEVPADQPVWPGAWLQHAARMLRGDLAAAGIPYVVEGNDGPLYCDFHALRHSFVSALADAGVGPKEMQILARHSDPRLTLAVYTHSNQDRLSDAVNLLPLPGAQRSLYAAYTRDQLETALAAANALISTILAG